MKFRHKKLAGYTYLEEVGQGGQGKVVKVKDPTGRREYALKLLNASSNIALFEKEVEALQYLNHSNVVQVYDANFNDQAGELYILMQYMKHGNIIKYLEQKNNVTIYEKLLMMQDVAQALQYVHKQKYVHRDVKPENIFVTDDGSGAYACLGDFGITKKIESETETEGGKGTRLYLPLEIILGEEGHSEASDMYGLGMSMYGVLAGRHPYDGVGQYMKKMMKKAPFPKPSSYNLLLNEKIDEICLKLITKNKEERYKNLDEFLDSLKVSIEEYSKINSNLSKKIDTIEKKKESEKYDKGVERKFSLKKRVIQAKEKLPYKMIGIIASTILAGFVGLQVYERNPSYFTFFKEVEVTDKVLNEELKENIDNGKVNDKKDDKELLKDYELLLKQAEKGDKSALVHLGEIYEKGYGKDKNYNEALKWYTRSWEEGNTSILSKIGDMHFERNSYIISNRSEALKWYEKALENGDGSVLEKLGDIYAYGGYMLKADRKKAKMFYEEALKKGYSREISQEGHKSIFLKIGDLYKFDMGEGVDWVEVIKWYKKAVEQGDTEALVVLGDIYMSGENVSTYINSEKEFEENYREGFKYYKKAADKGNKKSFVKMGNLHKYGGRYSIAKKNYTKALEWYKKAVDGGMSDRSVFMSIGDLYHKGDAVLKKDYFEAIKWYKKAAAKGSWVSLSRLEDLYEEYDGPFVSIEEDWLKSVEWNKKAGKEGDIHALYAIKKLYLSNFQEVKSNPLEAISWLKKIAKKGNVYALEVIGDFYKEGNKRLEKDYAEAVKWYEKFAKKGSVDALKNIGDLYKRGGPNLKKSYVEAIKWYEKAAEKGKVSLFYYIGSLYEDGAPGLEQNYSAAMMWYKKLVEKGYYRETLLSKGQYTFVSSMPNYSHIFIHIGNLYKKGGKGVNQDCLKALDWYRKGAGKCDGLAFLVIGNLYKDGGPGIEKDYAKASEYYEKSLGKEYSALDGLIEIYEKGGYGIRRDQAKANNYKYIRDSALK